MRAKQTQEKILVGGENIIDFTIKLAKEVSEVLRIKSKKAIGIDDIPIKVRK